VGILNLPNPWRQKLSLFAPNSITIFSTNAIGALQEKEGWSLTSWAPIRTTMYRARQLYFFKTTYTRIPQLLDISGKVRGRGEMSSRTRCMLSVFSAQIAEDKYRKFTHTVEPEILQEYRRSNFFGKKCQPCSALNTSLNIQKWT
jgi:hypothetical protein